MKGYTNSKENLIELWNTHSRISDKHPTVQGQKSRSQTQHIVVCVCVCVSSGFVTQKQKKHRKFKFGIHVVYSKCDLRRQLKVNRLKVKVTRLYKYVIYRRRRLWW